MNSHHPDPRRVGKGGPELRLLTPDPVDPLDPVDPVDPEMNPFSRKFIDFYMVR